MSASRPVGRVRRRKVGSSAVFPIQSSAMASSVGGWDISPNNCVQSENWARFAVLLNKRFGCGENRKDLPQRFLVNQEELNPHAVEIDRRTIKMGLKMQGDAWVDRATVDNLEKPTKIFLSKRS